LKVWCRLVPFKKEVSSEKDSEYSNDCFISLPEKPDSFECNCGDGGECGCGCFCIYRKFIPLLMEIVWFILS
jgi:hypothetical protein